MHLNCLIAHERICHSNDSKRQVWRKLSPAAEGNPPRGILFFAKIFLLRKNLSASFKRQVWRKLSVNKCFLAKSPVGSLPFVHREISHCGEISVRARVLPRETQRRGTLLGSFHFYVHAFLLLRKTNAVRGEPPRF